jgi:hypothetical protein
VSVLPRAESVNMRVIGHNDLGGKGDASQISVTGDHAYVGHMGTNDVGTSIVDLSDPTDPRLVGQIQRPPYTMSHKTQIMGDLLLVNHQKSRFGTGPKDSWSAGVAIYDISERHNPKQIGFYEAPGLGVHRMAVGDGPFAYVSRTDDGFIGRFLAIIDLTDPTQPTEIGRFWLPGQNVAAGEKPSWDPAIRNVKLHHGLPVGDRLYCGWGDGGFVSVDISDKTSPSLVSHIDFGPDSSDTHTALKVPARPLVLVADEVLNSTIGLRRDVRVIDVSDEANPEVISVLPPPPRSDVQSGNARFGPHNLHEMRPGSFIDSEVVYLTYFAGGLRVYDVSDASHPLEIASCVPEAPAGLDVIQINDVHVTEEQLVYVTDRRRGGLYVIAHDVS